MFTIDVKVTKIVREFLIAKYGSDTIQLYRDDYFTQKIKHILESKSKDYIPIKDDERYNYIRLQIHDFRMSLGQKSLSYTHEENAYLSEYLQMALSKEFTKYFKEVFHSYVLAYCIARGGKEGSGRDAIYSFCDIYCLPMNSIDYDMLRKSWSRSKEHGVLKKLQAKKCYMVSDNLWL